MKKKKKAPVSRRLEYAAETMTCITMQFMQIFIGDDIYSIFTTILLVNTKKPIIMEGLFEIITTFHKILKTVFFARTSECIREPKNEVICPKRGLVFYRFFGYHYYSDLTFTTPKVLKGAKKIVKTKETIQTIYFLNP